MARLGILTDLLAELRDVPVVRVVEQLLLKPHARIGRRTAPPIELLDDIHHAASSCALDEELGHVRRDAPINQSLGATEPPRFCVTFCVQTRYS